jgi:hypothetical protein
MIVFAGSAVLPCRSFEPFRPFSPFLVGVGEGRLAKGPEQRRFPAVAPADKRSKTGPKTAQKRRQLVRRKLEGRAPAKTIVRWIGERLPTAASHPV